MTKEQFIEKWLPNRRRIEDFIKEIDTVIATEIGYYLQDKLNDSDVGSLEWKIIKGMIDE